MQETIVQFFQRFRSDITQSIYAIKGIEDYNKLKAYYDYLDFDKKTIFRDKSLMQHCGLRNIGNTCYFNVLLQVLYHINFLREKIYMAQNKSSQLLESIKKLFGIMQIGKLVYSDPSQVFNSLKASHPNLFVQGVQNDFHQIFTLLLDQLKESLKQISEQDTKVIDKILFGKLMIKTAHPEGKSIRHTKFNIINLNSLHQNLDKALQNWKNYEIDDYTTQSGKCVKATVQTQFIQTPALMSFFINRVSFQNNKLVKDSRQFGFDDIIYLSKSSGLNGIKKLNKSFSSKEQQFIETKEKLTKWIEQIQIQKQNLKKSLAYVESKQFTNISLPQIQNKYEDCKVKEYLQDQISMIDKKIQETKQQIEKVQQKRQKLSEQNEAEMYNLWGLMIHQGNSPTSGHYKVIINTDDNVWTEFNDKKVNIIQKSDIQSYKKKGQICCLFYRRPNLLCNSKKSVMPLALKSSVIQLQKNILKEVDKARLLQNLHQIAESSGYLLQHENKQKSKNGFLYFFKPILHCFQSGYSFQQCQGVLTYEIVKNEAFKTKIRDSCLIEQNFIIPDLSLQIPSEYYKCSEIFKTFIQKELNTENISQAYAWLNDNLGFMPKNKLTKDWFNKYLEIFIMKGVFYLCVLYRVNSSPFIEAKFDKLFNSIQCLMKKMDQFSQFVLIYIPIKDEINSLFRKKLNFNKDSKDLYELKQFKEKQISKLMGSDWHSVIFMQRFKHFIEKRLKLNEIDQSIIQKELPLQKLFLVQK